MKKILLFVSILFLLSGSVQAKTFDGYNEGDWMRCTTGLFKNAVSVTQTNTTVTFTKDAKAIYVKNTGDTNELYVDPRDGVAVANDDDGGIKILAGEDFKLNAYQTRSIGLIASSGETTTAEVIACW